MNVQTIFTVVLDGGTLMRDKGLSLLLFYHELSCLFTICLLLDESIDTVF